MSNRPQITAILSLSILKHICPNNDPRIYWAREVTFDWATSHSVRVDFMKFKPVTHSVKNTREKLVVWTGFNQNRNRRGGEDE